MADKEQAVEPKNVAVKGDPINPKTGMPEISPEDKAKRSKALALCYVPMTILIF